MAKTLPVRPSAKELLKFNVLFRRARLQLSQVELAASSGVSRTWISRIESGAADVGIDTVDRIARALGVAIPDLFLDVREDDGPLDDAELARRANAPAHDTVDARTFLDAVDEAAGRPTRRYSNRGRRPKLPS